MVVVPAHLEDCLQPNLQQPSAQHPKREAFERDYMKKGFEYVYKKYGEDSFINKYRKVKKKIKGFIKLLINQK